MEVFEKTGMKLLMEWRSSNNFTSFLLFINHQQPPTQHKPKKFGFVDWFGWLMKVDWIKKRSLLFERKELKKYYNSKVAYYIHGQYDLLMEEGNWRNQINQLNLNGGCNGGSPFNTAKSISISSLRMERLNWFACWRAMPRKREGWLACFSCWLVGYERRAP